MLRSIILTLSACLLLSGTAMAADMKIAVVDMQTAGMQSEANKASRQKFEPMFAEDAGSLSKQKDAFEKKIKDFESQRGKLDQKAFEQRRMALQKEGQEIGEKDSMMRQKVEMTLNAVNDEMNKLAVKAAADVAKAKGLDLILPQNSALYSSGAMDVTTDMVEAMNRIWKADGSKIPGEGAAANVQANKPKPKGK